MSRDRPLMVLNHQPSTFFSGDSSAVAPPVPIPNTAVKRCSPDGSTAIGRARVGRRQNKMPGEFTSSGVLLSGVACPSRESSPREVVRDGHRPKGELRDQRIKTPCWETGG